VTRCSEGHRRSLVTTSGRYLHLVQRDLSGRVLIDLLPSEVRRVSSGQEPRTDRSNDRGAEYEDGDVNDGYVVEFGEAAVSSSERGVGRECAEDDTGDSECSGRRRRQGAADAARRSDCREEWEFARGL
jgi:hypothetical protein